MQTNKPFLSARQLARCAMIAAVYTVLCLSFAPLAFGPVQLRFAEALVLLPVFGPEYILAGTLGCFLSNLLGSTLPDVVFGTLATLLACLGTYALRGRRVRGLALPAALPPILANALSVGPELAFFFSDSPATLPLILWNGLTVALGEAVACGVLGVALIKLIETSAGLRRVFTE